MVASGPTREPRRYPHISAHEKALRDHDRARRSVRRRDRIALALVVLWVSLWLGVITLLAVSTGRAQARASPCSEPPRAWGSRLDVAEGERNGHVWHPVACGNTRNVFGRWVR